MRIKYLLIMCVIFLNQNGFAEFAQVAIETVPSERIITNLEKDFKNKVMTADMYWELARAYSIAATQADVVKDSSIPDVARNANLIPSRINYMNLALKNYDAAIKLNPSEKKMYLGRGWVYKMLKKNVSAKKDLRLVFDHYLSEFDKFHEKKLNKLKVALSSEIALNQRFNEIYLYGLVNESLQYLKEVLDKKKDQLEINEIDKKMASFNMKFEQLTVHESMRAAGAQSPIIFSLSNPDADLNELVAFDKYVSFDLDGQGKKFWQWVQPGTGFLVYLGNNKFNAVKSGRQLFGNITFWIFWNNGYEALAALDDNQDGILRGAELNGIFVWQDKNQDGLSTPDEIYSLKSLGIIGINISSQKHKTGIYYNPKGIIYKNNVTHPSFDWVSYEKP